MYYTCIFDSLSSVCDEHDTVKRISEAASRHIHKTLGPGVGFDSISPLVVAVGDSTHIMLTFGEDSKQHFVPKEWQQVHIPSEKIIGELSQPL